MLKVLSLYESSSGSSSGGGALGTSRKALDLLGWCWGGLRLAEACLLTCGGVSVSASLGSELYRALVSLSNGWGGLLWRTDLPPTNLADWDLAAGLRLGATASGAANASILADAGAHIDWERFVRPSVAMVALILTNSARLNLLHCFSLPPKRF